MRRFAVVGFTGLLVACAPEPLRIQLDLPESARTLVYAETSFGMTHPTHRVEVIDLNSATAPGLLVGNGAWTGEPAQRFVAMVSESSPEALELSEGQAYPPAEGEALRTLENVFSDASPVVLQAQPSYDSANAEFSKLDQIPEDLGMLSIGSRSRCLTLRVETQLQLPVRGRPNFAAELPDGSLLIGLEIRVPPGANGERAMFHIDPDLTLREVRGVPFTDQAFVDGDQLWFIDLHFRTYRSALPVVTSSTIATISDLTTYSMNEPAHVWCNPGTGRSVLRDAAATFRGGEIDELYVVDTVGAVHSYDPSTNAMSCLHQLLEDRSYELIERIGPKQVAMATQADVSVLVYDDGVLVEDEEVFPDGQFAGMTYDESLGLVVAQSTGGLLAFRKDGDWTRRELAGAVIQPSAVLATPHPTTGEQGVILGSAFGQVSDWWPGEPEACPSPVEALLASDILFVRPLAGGYLLIADASSGSQRNTAFAWVTTTR